MTIHYTLTQLPEIAQKIIQFQQQIQKESSILANIWTFEGQMGAGKTTLIKEICKQLGVTANVQSPTYSIVNQYDITNNQQNLNQKDSQKDNQKENIINKIFHFDFYRLKDITEAYDIGYEDYFYPQKANGNTYLSICLVEWASRVQELIPENSLNITINIISEDKREITVSESGFKRW